MPGRVEVTRGLSVIRVRVQMRVRDKVIWVHPEQGRLEINATRGYGVGLGIDKL